MLRFLHLLEWRATPMFGGRDYARIVLPLAVFGASGNFRAGNGFIQKRGARNETAGAMFIALAVRSASER